MHYQLGGFRSDTFHWFRHDTRVLADFVFYALSTQPRQHYVEQDPVELVLGILGTGASYLLVSEDQMEILLRARKSLQRPRRPRDASSYLSLSPITFQTSDELYEKLRKYEHKQKRKTPGKAMDRDVSAANSMYCQWSPGRASFEHQRVLWSAIQKPIDKKKFGLYDDPYWIASASIVALALDTWKSEPVQKMKNDPTILSLELASIRCIAFDRKDYAHSISDTLRVKIKEHSLMSNGPSANDEKLEITDKADLGKRLNDFFSSIDSKYALLLVYDAEQTLSALKKLGIDVSSYEIGIDALLYGENKKQADAFDSKDWQVDQCYYRRGSHSFQERAYESKPSLRDRSSSPRRRPMNQVRSRSPICGHPDAQPSPYPSLRADNVEDNVEAGLEAEEDEEDELPPARVHIIDVLSLFLAVSKFARDNVKDLYDLVGRLGISPDSIKCRLLIESWRSMASGKAIDEQYADRASSGAFIARRVEHAPIAEPAPEPIADEEVDPNDVPVNQSNSRPLAIVPGGPRPHDTNDYDSDDSDA